ncbi:MAG: endonuclease MutS2, partial [Armatimonadetes bacterium]|nr:endonuclease MutS2 [Armatimonadota bacterium]
AAVAGADGTLDAPTLLAVADTVQSARKLRLHLLAHREACPLLGEKAGWIGEFRVLEEEIAAAVDERAELRDEASPLLSRLRREMRAVRSRMMERLQGFLRNSQYRDMIQDPVITTRDGRFCIPVKSEYRVQFGGLVHDQSSSGATVFMEPMVVVELGNELRQLEAKERQEVERILRELSALVGRHSEPLRLTLEILADLDFIGARGRLALELDAVEPGVEEEEGCLYLRKARHPLLTGPVVPIDLELGRDAQVLIITGPNTGGKTVALKTVGLLALMAQCGLHVPAGDGSRLPVFEGVYADIGDEQSIQQSLSTFSGHITNIARILGQVERSGPRSLVLLDEAGAGTDPTEGAALARSILERLRVLGARVIATTHYGELKEYAYGTQGVENASVEFDLETLRPTYRLLIGIPGASNAFAIAARLGLPPEVLEGARERVGSDRVELSDVIQRLTEDQRLTEQDLRRATAAAQEMEAKRRQYEQELQRVRADREDTLNRARKQAEELLRGAKKEVERVRQELRGLERDARKALEEGARPQALQQFRDRLTAITNRVEQREDRTLQPPKPRRSAAPPAASGGEEVQFDPRPAGVGDLVWVAGFNQRGTLLTAPDGGRAQVQIGAMRVTVPAGDLRRILAGAALPTAPPPASPTVAAARPAP